MGGVYNFVFFLFEHRVIEGENVALKCQKVTALIGECPHLQTGIGTGLADSPRSLWFSDLRKELQSGAQTQSQKLQLMKWRKGQPGSWAAPWTCLSSSQMLSSGLLKSDYFQFVLLQSAAAQSLVFGIWGIPLSSLLKGKRCV